MCSWPSGPSAPRAAFGSCLCFAAHPLCVIVASLNIFGVGEGGLPLLSGPSVQRVKYHSIVLGGALLLCVSVARVMLAVFRLGELCFRFAVWS